MKKHLKFIVAIWLVLVTVSCEDYLKTNSNSSFSDEVTFSNVDFATKAVYNVYDRLTDEYGGWAYMMFWFKCDNDIETCFNANANNHNDIAHYAATPSTMYLSQPWNALYKAIEAANICIDALPKSAIWTDEYAGEAHRLYGEAITLRAYFYSELINLWGDVPFKLEATTSDGEFYLPKTDRDEIYEYLIQDLKEIEDYIPWMSVTQTTERVNRAYVKGLRARLALAYAGYSLRNGTFETRRGRNWEDYYEIALQECKEVLESGKHQLNPDFENVFRTLHGYSMDMTHKEILFEVAFGRLKSGPVGSDIGVYHNDTKYGKANVRVRTPPSYYYTFDRKDIRRNVACILYNYAKTGAYLNKQYPASLQGLGQSKFRREWIVPSMGGDLSASRYTGVNFPLMRYSDIILMFAEAENQVNGPTQAAKEALSLIRERAFPEDQWASKVMNYVDSVSVSKEAFFNAIVDERAFEFGGEFMRKVDLVRWNLLGTKIAQMKDDVRKIITNDPTYRYHSKLQRYLFWKYKEDGETMEILNPDFDLGSAEIDGYTRTAWFPSSSASSINTMNGVLDKVANGYDAAKNNHLAPIHESDINDSNGMLRNDQIP